MQFRFTLSNTIAGTQVINNPDGWQDIKVKLERDVKYHSLIEKIEVPLIFYGSNSVVDGGYDYIKNVITTQGINAIIVLLIEISEDEGQTYDADPFFTGNLELSDKQEFSEGDTFYKLQCPIIQTSLWSKFFNRIETSVDLQSATDLDGNSVEVIEPIELNLLSQTIDQYFERKINYNPSNTTPENFQTAQSAAGTTSYLIFGNADPVLDEIEERSEYGTQISNEYPPDVFKNIWKVKFDGTYDLDATIRYAIFLNSNRNVEVKWFYGVRSGYASYYEVQIGSTQTETGAATIIDELNGGPRLLNVTLTLRAGDEVYLFGKITLSSSVTQMDYYPDYYGVDFGVHRYTELTLTSHTTYQNTTTDALLIHDVFKSITERITGEPNSFYSENLGGIIHGYAENGCNYKYANMRGLHVRGYSFADKPFFQSMKDQWDGADPCFNLGLGYEDLNQSPYQRVIRIEPKEYFYNEDISVNLDFVDNIKSTYDKNYIFKSIAIGYQKWSAESASGIDDPQTKKNYATLFEQIGTPSSLLSKFFAAALAIEQARRLRVEQSKDYRLDEEVMIIALDEDISPLFYSPEFDENFSDIANLNNPDKRYNLRLTPAWNFLRWINFFKGCLESNYSTSNFKFTGGEGNYDFEARMDDTSDCILGVGSPDDLISEKANIPADIKSDYLHLPDMYEFNFKLSWSQYKTIRNNRNKAIGVSQNDSGHETCFINLLEWSPTNALADFKVWLK